MAKLYYVYIVAGKKTFNDVTPRYLVEVRQLLKDNGYTINNDGTVTKGK